MSKPWFLYIASSKAGKLYVGISTDVERRLATHNAGRGSVFVKQNGQLQLVYVSPALENQSQARKREIELKSWPKSKKLELINS